MSYNTQEMSEIRVTSKIDRTALTETLLIVKKNSGDHNGKILTVSRKLAKT